MATMSNKLKVLRAEHNLTQAQLADLVKVTRSTINYIEKNEYMPSLALATRIARYFNKPIEEIFIVEDDEEYINRPGESR
jgi:putative transcriptional regulator